ncbi:flagellar export protein FliJ [Aquabacterium sp.]|uniref:flagellar export protein FliJ n=1 Tax=Aquabacterium sp. TaxID=1872578 RepID=UPI002CD93241|nr:flagellar export protein FliJ [Aquabacterium sp.]HSW05750.1 flagellar export protein FliJ [Aquabacterium sp.]
MDSSTSLTLLLEQAESARDAQQTVLRNCEAAAAHAQAQADQLLAYRGQYEQRWSTHFRQAGAIELLQCVQGFSQRLEQAISHQGHASAQAQARVAQARQQLIALEQRVAAVRKLIERRQAEQRRAADRREQRSTDEAAQRRPSGSRLTPSLI